MAANGSSSTACRLQLEDSDQRFYRELNDLKIGFGMRPVFRSCDPMMNQVYERTIFVKIHREFFAISCEILYEVFSRYGIIDWVERLSCGFHSTILFRDKESTLWAFEFLNGMNLYGDCCQLELFLAKEPKERSKSQSNTTSSDESTVVIELETSIDSVEIQIQPECPKTPTRDNIRGSCEILEIDTKASIRVEATVEELSQEADSSPQIAEDSDGQEVLNEHSKLPICSLLSERRTHEQIENQNPQVFQDSREREMGLDSSKVKFESLDSVWGDDCLASVNGVNSNTWVDSIGFLEIPSAQYVFVEMLNKYDQLITRLVEEKMPEIAIADWSQYLAVFDPGGRSHSVDWDERDCLSKHGTVGIRVFDLRGGISASRGIDMEVLSGQLSFSSIIVVVNRDLRVVNNGLITLPFDRGRASKVGMLGLSLIVWNWIIDCGIGCLSMKVQLVSVRNFVFDPGGIELGLHFSVDETLPFQWWLLAFGAVSVGF